MPGAKEKGIGLLSGVPARAGRKQDAARALMPHLWAGLCGNGTFGRAQSLFTGVYCFKGVNEIASLSMVLLRTKELGLRGH